MAGQRRLLRPSCGPDLLGDVVPIDPQIRLRMRGAAQNPGLLRGSLDDVAFIKVVVHPNAL